MKPRYNHNPPCLSCLVSQIYRLTELRYFLWTSEKCTMVSSNLIFPYSVLPWPLSWPRYGTYACVTILDRSCARLSCSFPLLDSWLVHPVVVGFLTVYAAAAVNSPHGRCGSCFFRWQQQNSSSRVMITHISSRNRRRGFCLTLPHPRRFDPGDSVVKQMQLSLLIAATRKRADWRRGNDETGCRILCADAR